MRAIGRVAVLFAASSLGSPVVASAAVTVGSPAEFHAAVARMATAGGTVILRARRYDTLVISRRGDRPLRVVARSGASARRLALRSARRVEVRGLRLTPSAGRHAELLVSGSAHVRFTRLFVIGSAPYRANGAIIESTDVRFVESTFAQCGEGRTPVAGFCLRLRDNNGFTVRSSRFHDCRGCDFIHGVGNARVVIAQSAFDRAIPGQCGTDVLRCNHQDSIHLRDGRDVVIDRNRFGLQFFGAAQVYLTGSIRRVSVTNNVFVGTDPRAPGVVGPVALWVGNRSGYDVPRPVSIRNNTVLTGAPRTLSGDDFEMQSSILLSPRYSGLPAAARPLLANNVIALARTPVYLCSQVRASIANVFVDGRRCSRRDAVGDPAVDAEGRPTASSRLLVDRASRRHATRLDILGVIRDARPDIGAYEYAS